MFALPAVDRYHLANPPLVQALAQVRYPLQAKLGTLDGIVALQDRLGDAFPYLEQHPQADVEFALGPDGPRAHFGGNGNYVFSSDDGHAVVVSPDTATCTAGTGYGSVETFAAKFELLLESLVSTTRIPRFDRLGARYLNLATVPPGDSAAWSRWFRPELTGWIAADEVLDKDATVESSITQTTITCPAKGSLAKLPADATALVRHGLAPAGSVVPGMPPISVDALSFIIDVDCFVVAPHGPDVSAVVKEFRALHDQIDRFFLWTLAPEGAEYFGVEETA